jgi:DNA-binding response OmpR family regulator
MCFALLPAFRPRYAAVVSALVKPFSPHELVARIHAVVRHCLSPAPIDRTRGLPRR